MRVNSIVKFSASASVSLLALALIAFNVSAAGKPVQVQAKLNEARLKMCQAKETVIRTRTENLTRMANNMLQKFSQIEARVEEFYSNKNVPEGKTVANYDKLVSEVKTKKEVAEKSLASAQKDSAGFSCNGNDPKGMLTSFRKDMQVVKTSLKDYRTSIKNLIVAIHSVNGSSEKGKSGTPKPTKTGGNN